MEDDRRMIPWTIYPFSRSYSVRYDPSCPEIPEISANIDIDFPITTKWF